MALEFYDRVKFTISNTPGTGGTYTSSTAVSGYLTLASIPNIYTDASFPYLVEEGSNWEYGVGYYNGSGSLVRIQTIWNSNNGSSVSFTSAAIVSIVPLGRTLSPHAGTSVFTGLDTQYFPTTIGTGIAAGSTTTADTIMAMPFFVPQQVYFNRMGVRTGSTTAAQNLKIGLYRDRNNGNVGQGNSAPGKQIATATLFMSGGYTTIEGTINVYLSPGLYWMLLLAVDNVLTLNAFTSNINPAILGLSSTYSPVSRLTATRSYASGLLSDETSTTFALSTTAWAPIMHLRKV